MSRRRATVRVSDVLTAVVEDDLTGDGLTERALDAAEALLRSSGLRRWSVDDVADRAGLGRTTVYRRFGNRDELVHAVLGRELRRVLAAIARAAADVDDPEDKAVAAVTTALSALDGSVVRSLVESDPATFLPLITTDAGALLAIAREAIAAQLATVGERPSPEVAEMLARVGLSFVLTRDTVLPLGDAANLDAAVRNMVRPLLAAVV